MGNREAVKYLIKRRNKTMCQVKYFLIFAIFVVGIILAIGIKERFDINREIISAPIMSSCSEGSPSGTIKTIYAMYFYTREDAYSYCKSLPQNREYVLSSEITYKDLQFGIKVKNCESLPKKSICIDKNNCFIKYGDE